MTLYENRADRFPESQNCRPQSQMLLWGCSAGRVMANTHQQIPWHFQVQPPFLGTVQIYCPCIITAPRRNNNYFLKSSEPSLGRIINPSPVLGCKASTVLSPEQYMLKWSVCPHVCSSFPTASAEQLFILAPIIASRLSIIPALAEMHVLLLERTSGRVLYLL